MSSLPPPTLQAAIAMETLLQSGVHPWHIHTEGRRIIVSGLASGFSDEEKAAVERVAKTIGMKCRTPRLLPYPMFLWWDMELP